jgi:hypothetical protein
VKSDLIDIAVEVRHDTPRAYLVHDGHRDVWLPKSQCEVHETTTAGAASRSWVVTLPEWLAQKTELI